VGTLQSVIDLHMHSNFSDGSDDPEVLAEHAHRVGITTLSLTDHDTTESYPRMAAACQGLGIELIAGVEVSLKDVEAVKVREDGTREKGVSVHVLAYFVPIEPEHPFQQLLIHLRNDRRTRNIKLVELLQQNGFTRLTYDDILARAKSEYSVGRPHFAQAMFEHHPEIVGENNSSNWQKLFNEWIGSTGKAYLPKTDLRIEDFVEAARGSGVVFSIAHPTLNYFGSAATNSEIEQQMPTIMASLKSRGVQGIECYYGSWNQERRDLLAKLTKDAGMIPTGGSDYHGSFKENVRIGHGLTGDLHVPADVVTALRAARTF